MAVYTETIKLDDKVSDPAKSAAKEVKVLESAIAATENALVKAGATGNVKKYQSLQKEITAYRSALELLPKAEEQQTVATVNTGKAMFDASNAMKVGKETIMSSIGAIKNAITSLAAGDVKGAIAGVTEAFAGMAQLLDLVVPGLGQAAAAVIKVAGGLAGLAAGLIQSGMAMAIEASEGKQAMLSYLDAMGQGVVTGEKYEAMIDGVKDKLGVAKDSLVGWTKQLQSAGMTDLGQIENNLHAIASASALMGKEGEQAFLGLTEKLNTAAMTGSKFKLADKQIAALGKTGANVADIAKKMGLKTEDLRNQLVAGSVDATKFGNAMQEALIEKGAGPLAKLSASLPNLKKLLNESIGDLFEDVDVGPFLAEVKELFSIFSQGKPSGQAMKAGVGGAFQSIFNTATKLVPYVKHFLLDLVIYGLKAYIALKPILKWFDGLKQNQKVMSFLKTAFEGVKFAAVLLAASVAALVIGFGAVVAVGMAIAATFYTIIGAIMEFLDNPAKKLNEWAAGAVKLGSDFVMGLVNGISSGVSLVTNAVTNLANSAEKAFKETLGIASPSKKMFKAGGFAGEGAALGIESKETEVHAASSSLGGATSSGFAAGSGESNSSSSGGGVSVVVEAGAIVIQGGSGSAEQLTEEAVSMIFERVAMAQGL